MIVYPKQSLSKLLIFIMFITSSVFSIGPAYIKDTYLPVADKLRYLSPIHGAMWWEGGVVRKYYEFGPMQEKNKNDEDWLPKADGPVRLIHALFNIVQGSFGISTNASYPAHHLSAKTIAKIVAALEKHQGKITAIEIENIILSNEDFLKSIEITKKNYDELYKKYKPVLINIDSQLKKLNTVYLDKLQVKNETKKTKLTDEEIKELDALNPEIKKEYDEAKKVIESERNNINQELGKHYTKFLFNPLMIETEDFIKLRQTKELSDKNIELKKYQDELSKVNVSKELNESNKNLQNKVEKFNTRIAEIYQKRQAKKIDLSSEEKTEIKELKSAIAELEKKLFISDPQLGIKNIIKRLNAEIKMLRDKFKAELAHFSSKLELLKKTGGEPGFRRLRELAQAIVDAYNDKSNLYSPYCVYYILTAFMYRKAISKQELWDYFDILNKELKSIFVPQLDRNQWINTKFDESEIPTIKEELEEWLKSSGMTALTEKFYEDAVYGQIIECFYKSNFPKLAGYSKIKFETSESFSDCAETTIRNLCNIILYIKNSSSFDLSKVPTIDLKSPFAEFYKHNSSATLLENKSVHQAWAPVIENQSWVTYRRKTDKDGRTVFVPDYKKGFLVVPSNLSNELFEQIIKLDFIPIDGITEKGYEVRSSIRNIIILLDHFFGLKLFTDISKDFLKPDFNETFFPQLAKQIKPLAEAKYNEQTIDTDDFSLTKRSIFKFWGGSIEIFPGHAELKINYDIQNIVNLAPKLIEPIINNKLVKNEAAVQLLSIYQLTKENFETIAAEVPFSIIFFTNLFDNNMRDSVFTKYLVNNMGSENQAIKTACTQTALSIIKILLLQPDLIYFSQAMDELRSPIESIGNFVTTYAQQIVDSDLPRSLELLDILVEKNYTSSYKIATETAAKAVTSKNVNVQREGLYLFRIVVERKYEKAFEKASDAAEKAVKNKNEYVQEAGLNLFAALVEQKCEEAVENATEAAKKAIMRGGYEALQPGLNLFEKLFKLENKKAFDEATIAAEKAVMSEDYRVQEYGLKLFEKLVERKKAFDKAGAAARGLLRTSVFPKIIDMAEVLLKKIEERQVK